MRPDFEKMSGPELVKVYNEMAAEAAGLGIQGVQAIQKFRMIAAGVKRCSELWIKIAGAKSGEAVEEGEAIEENAPPSNGADAPPSEIDIPTSTEEEEESMRKSTGGRSTKAAKKARGKVAKKTSKKAAVKTEKAPRERKIGDYPLTAKIEVLVDENPRNEGSAAHKRFASYSSCKTLADYAKKWPAKARGDILWDLERKHIKVIKA